MAATTARSRPSSILILPSPECIMSSASSISSIAPTRRITFAPLPEPNRDEHPNNSANSLIPSSAGDLDPPTEDPLASSSSSSSSQLSSSTNSILRVPAEKSSPDSSVGSSPIIQLTHLPSKYSSISPVLPLGSNANTNSPPAPLSWKKPYSLLRPFKRFSTSSSGSSSHTLTPTPSIESRTRRSFTKEEILTLGAVNLFRTTSQESTRDSDSSSLNGWSLGLTRWASLGSSNISLPSGSSPLTRTQSTQSYKSKSHSLFPAFSSSSSSLSSDSKSKSKATPSPVVQQPRANRHKGTRMLNGRVYGGPKKNANPFASARDEEPEFVEWGYGGMGSVKGAKSAGVGTNWEILHGGSSMTCDDKSRIDVGVGGVGAGIGAIDADVDDGSGLAWVKRRKEERERKAREQEAEKENSESQMNTPVPTRSNTLETTTSALSMAADITLPLSVVELATHARPTTEAPPLTVVLEEDGESNLTPTPSRYPSKLHVSSLQKPSSSLTEENTSTSKPEEGGANNNPHESERVLQAITIPVRAPRLHHRQPSKGSREVVLPWLSTEDAAAVSQIQVVGSPSGVDDTTDSFICAPHMVPVEIDKPITPSSSSSSGSESESEVDGDDEDDDEEEEEEELGKEREKNTKLGDAAGVEKISRHNKE